MKNSAGFNLTELMVALVILAVLFTSLSPALTDFIDSNKHRQDLTNVDAVIRQTLTECLKQGREGRISVVGKIIRGEVLNNLDQFVEVDQYTLLFSTFGRENTIPTPLLSSRLKNVATSFPNNVIPVNTLGVIVPLDGGASGVDFFLKRGESEAVIEILSSGLMAHYFQQKGETTWAR